MAPAPVGPGLGAPQVTNPWVLVHLPHYLARRMMRKSEHSYRSGHKSCSPATSPEPAQQPHDGFIASFDLQYQNTLGTSSPTAPARNLVVNPCRLKGSGPYTSLVRMTGR